MSEILAQVTRSGRVESVHRGHIAVVDPDGRLAARAGNVAFQTYIRSAAKPVQILPLMESGAVAEYGLIPSELAVIMASHNGEAFHLDAVRSIHTKVGLSEKDLRCGFHPPMLRESAEDRIRQNLPPSSLCNNCSGKHSGMLTLAKYQGWPLATYLESEHTVQKAIKAKVADFTDIEQANIITGIDGCSAPVFYLEIQQMARMYARLASGEISASERAFGIMSSYPEMIAGTGRFDTAFMRALAPRAISKIGAEGVRCVGLRTQSSALGLAIKVEDGSSRVTGAILLEALKQLELINEIELAALSELHFPVLRNCVGLDIGTIQPVLNLKHH